MVGNQDILTPRGDAEELAERIPTAELVVISGAAHGFMIEHATTFNRILLEFLGRAETAHQARRRRTSSTPHEQVDPGIDSALLSQSYVSDAGVDSTGIADTGHRRWRGWGER